MSRIAVIIVNYNGGEMLARCLAAVSAQTVRPARVLVLDNGSCDGSIDGCRVESPWAEYCLLNANLGFARANNLGVKMADDCEWVALLNPDAFPEPTWIEAFQRGAKQFPDADAFASCMVSATRPDVADGAGDAYRVDGLAWPRFKGEPTWRMPQQPEEVFAACAGASFYRRRAFVAAGGFCERYFCYYEDVDLGFRLRLRGGRCLYLPGAVVRHIGSAITGAASEFSTYHVHRNFVWTYFRNMPAPYVWWYLPAHVAANLASVVVFIRKGHGRTILRAKCDALRGLWRTLCERQEIQRQRRVPPLAVVARMNRGNLMTTAYRLATRWRQG